MTASPFLVRCGATCLLVASLPAQNPPPGTIQKLLPPDAKIIETANLSLGPGKVRALALWMEHPERVVDRDAGLDCVNQVYGDHWVGPTRLSLVDLAKSTLVNTVEIRSSDEQPNDKEHVFQIPFLVSNSYYQVPRPNAKKEGQPTILNLHDLTGEGIPGQFVVFEYVACGVASGSVFGYSPRSERAVQYSVEIVEGDKKPTTEAWVMEIFGTKSIHPGRWDFTWDPGHGCFCTIHEQVSFDRVRQVFVNKHTVMSYPDVPK
jgi:hypothetical protein